ncbi:Mannose-6-phosphate isomerase [Tulasnella sp. 418]|nr:Mannose-6-phosphate isomerase [Tulasnella sp. 418]
MSIFRLIAGAQSYDWGKIGQDSKVAQYASTCSPSFQLDEKKPYAELWMGTHPSMPSKLASTGEGLKEFLQRDPERFIGKKVVQRFSGEEGPDLPFLFKVLAIRKALSIQAHPDKELARTLHQERPDIYKGLLLLVIDQGWIADLCLSQMVIISLKWPLHLPSSRASADFFPLKGSRRSSLEYQSFLLS